VLGALTTRLFGQPPAQLARLMLLGGVSSSEPILMWWKFVGRTHEEIAGFREEWEFGSKRFGRVEGLPRPGRTNPAADTPDRHQAPALPAARRSQRLGIAELDSGLA
jgi:hypothetical protein